MANRTCWLVEHGRWLLTPARSPNLGALTVVTRGNGTTRRAVEKVGYGFGSVFAWCGRSKEKRHRWD